MIKILCYPVTLYKSASWYKISISSGVTCPNRIAEWVNSSGFKREIEIKQSCYLSNFLFKRSQITSIS